MREFLEKKFGGFTLKLYVKSGFEKVRLRWPQNSENEEQAQEKTTAGEARPNFTLSVGRSDFSGAVVCCGFGY